MVKNNKILSLNELLYKVKIENKIEYLNQILKYDSVKDVIKKTIKRIHGDKKKLQYNANIILQDYILKEYVYEFEYTEERFLHYIKKYLGKRLRSGED